MPLTIHTIDLHYLGIPQSIAAYLVIGPPPDDIPVLIETGPASTLDHLRAGLDPHGLQLHDIRHALVTHIHLDHAGAAGHLAQHGTRIHVHEFGAPHLIDPSRLIASASRIYGDQMERLWGTLLPVPQDQITPVHDGDVIQIGSLRFEAIQTPGHARHHHAYAVASDQQSAVSDQPPAAQTLLNAECRSLTASCFVGDIAGISVPGGLMTIPTPPPEFDPPAWHVSIERLRERNFSKIYLTHFGARHNVPAHFDRLRALIDAHVEFVRRHLAVHQTREEILGWYTAFNRQQADADGVSDQVFERYVSANLLAMNVDGIMRYAAGLRPRAA